MKKWDEHAETVTRKHKQRHEFEALLQFKKQQVLRELLIAEESEKPISSKEIIDKLRKPKDTTIAKLYAFIKPYLAELVDKPGKHRTAMSLKEALLAFKKFQPKDILFSDITAQTLNDFEAHCRTRTMRDTTILIYIRGLCRFYKLAIEEGQASRNDYPFERYKISRLDHSTKKRALTKELVKALMKVPTIPCSSQRFAQAMFTLSYLCRGINLVDLAYLTKANLIEGRLEYVRSKTGKRFSIAIRPEVQAILDELRPKKGSDGYLLPILSAFFKTEKQRAHRIQKVNKDINDGLSEVAAQLGIQHRITIYAARHSYATVLKRSGVSTSMISEALGHSSEAVTQVYLDSFDKERLYDLFDHLL